MDASVAGLWRRTSVRLRSERYRLARLPLAELSAAARLVASATGFAALLIEADSVSVTLDDALWLASDLGGAALAEAGPMRLVSLEVELGLDVCGYLAPAAVELAAAGIPIVPQCGFTRDQLLVREIDASSAVAVLERLVERAAEAHGGDA